MTKFVMYTEPNCPYVENAKGHLAALGANITEIDLCKHQGQRDKMIDRANGKNTVPQIFFDDKHIGGFDDLMLLQLSGLLDTWFDQPVQLST